MLGGVKMFDLLKDEMLKNDIKGAMVDLYVYPDNTYSIIPLGRAFNKEWIGAKTLNYKETGNFNVDDNDTLMSKIYKSLVVSYNYNNMGIEPSGNMEIKFTKDGKECGFKGYRYISIVLFASKGLIKINELKPIDMKGSEWVGKSDTSISLSTEECKNIKYVLTKYLDENCR